MIHTLLIIIFFSIITEPDNRLFNDGYYSSYINNLHDLNKTINQYDGIILERLGYAHFQRAKIYKNAHFLSLLLLSDIIDGNYNVDNKEIINALENINYSINYYKGINEYNENKNNSILTINPNDNVCDYLIDGDCHLYLMINADNISYDELYKSLSNLKVSNRTMIFDQLVKLNSDLDKVLLLIKYTNRLSLLWQVDFILSHRIYEYTNNKRKYVSLYSAGKNIDMTSEDDESNYYSLLKYANKSNINKEKCSLREYDTINGTSLSRSYTQENHSLLTFTLPFLMNCGAVSEEKNRRKVVDSLTKKMFNRIENNAELLQLLLLLDAEEKALQMAKNSISRAKFYRYEKIRPLTLSTLTTLFYINPTTEHWRESRHLFSLLEDEFSHIALTGTLLQLATVNKEDNNNKIYIE